MESRSSAQERCMFDEIMKLSQSFLKTHNKSYQRGFLKENKLSNRFSVLTGQRGVGKTTILIQYILNTYKDIFTNKALYVPADHFVIGKSSLYSLAEEFMAHGGELICFDEIHKYPAWEKELKSIYDTFPDLKIILSGSSSLELHQGLHDLSRRAINYKIAGLSFREFIELNYEVALPVVSLDKILSEHQVLSHTIIKLLDTKKLKILPLFKEYLKYGYYPYSLDYEDKNLFYIALEQDIHTSIESDLLAVHPSITGVTIKKIKKLLSIIASSVPFKPDLKTLKTSLDVGDERTLKTYFKYLEEVGIIQSLSNTGKKLKTLEKPDKIYLNNTAQIFAVNQDSSINIGNLRETYFLNTLSFQHLLSVPQAGDFFVDNQFTFEVGGKNKFFEQIKDIKNSFLALDEMETGLGKKIPLWLFGFIY